MKVKELMVPSVRAWFANHDLAIAARLMWEQDCRCVPVQSDQARVIGMITDRDIWMAVFFQGVPMSAIRVAEVMSRQLVICSSDDDLSSAAVSASFVTRSRQGARQMRRIGQICIVLHQVVVLTGSLEAYANEDTSVSSR